MKKLLVTGGAGFIGSEFVRRAADKKYQIAVVDKLTYAGDLRRLESVKGKFRFYKADICDRKKMFEIFKKEKASAVAHFAAESIPENIYIPIQSVPHVGTRMINFDELWKEQKRNNKIKKTEKGEAIFLRGTQTKVLSFLNGGQWMPIKAITRHWYKGKIVKLKQKWGIIEATPNHSIYSANLELTNPEVNPELLVIRSINEIRKKPKKVSNNLLKILAAYITEGNATFNKANGGYIVDISQSCREWLEDLGKTIKSEFGLNCCIVRHKKGKHKDCFGLQVSNKKFFNYLIENCGKYCDGKYFPNWIFDLEPKQREFFLEKLFERDGTKDGRYSTTSYKLANQLSLLFALQEKKFRIFEYDRKNYKRSWEFKTKLSGQHYGLNKKEKTEFDYKGWVYDLEVENTHNFVCGIGNVVCHNSHVDRSISDATPFMRTNVLGTQVILDASLKYKVKKICHISTDEVYGEIENGKFTENSPFRPNSPYAVSKAAADMLASAYYRTYNLPVVIVRASNNYGPWQFPEKLIPVIIQRALAGEKVPVYAKGENVREWLYVSDCAGAVFKVLEKGRTGEAYNVGSGEEKRNIDVVKIVLRVLGVSGKLIKFVKDRPGHDIRYSLNTGKINGELKWRANMGFSAGIQQTARWYVENQKWTKSVERRIK